ncbi:MAG: GDP-mannose 4,6-dehydratase [Candidatus Zixiibacteriota bacterium]|nr:MAG: GDP-mannose 4,6-dehydratase [candidate division Zixibacteria bacterium]
MSQPVAFITGIAGFAGSHLAEELLAHGYHVTGALYPNEPTVNIVPIIDRLSLTELDILDEKGCREAVMRYKPDIIFHLAAFASVGKSFSKERLVYRINFDGTLNMLSAAIRLARLKKFVFISSCDCYGVFSPKGKTLTESQPFNPVSPYGISKAAAEFACQAYVKRYELPVVISRSFNHSGPRQSRDFVIPSFARQIAVIEKGRAKPVIKVGDLSVRRDLSDVRDIVRGYRLLAEKGRVSQAYNLCSGRAVAISSVLNTMLRSASKKIIVKTDPARLRPNDIPTLRGDNGLATRDLGYKARFSLNQTIRDTVDYWRGKI